MRETVIRQQAVCLRGIPHERFAAPRYLRRVSRIADSSRATRALHDCSATSKNGRRKKSWLSRDGSRREREADTER